MSLTAWYRAADETDAPHAFDSLDFIPDERVGQPLVSRWRGRTIKGAALAVVGFTVGSALLDDQSLARWLWLTAREAAEPLFERAVPIASAPPAPSPTPEAPPPPVPELAAVAAVQPAALPPEAIPAAPPPQAPTAEEDQSIADPPPPTRREPDRPPPLAKPRADDPLQKRALAAGLHPDLSRALLARLSDADFRNAAMAVRTALAESPDDGEWLWPRQRQPGQALFKITFVRGASPECRRYVVAIAKDGWRTTALPLEKCSEPSRAAAKK